MNILQELRLGGRWITTKEHIDFASDPASSTLRELFRDATEELAKDAFLDIFTLPDGWGKRVDEDILDI